MEGFRISNAMEFRDGPNTIGRIMVDDLGLLVACLEKVPIKLGSSEVGHAWRSPKGKTGVISIDKRVFTIPWQELVTTAQRIGSTVHMYGLDEEVSSSPVLAPVIPNGQMSIPTGVNEHPRSVCKPASLKQYHHQATQGGS